MGTFSIWHWIIVLAVILLLFGGRGKIPNLMRDMGQGINAFKKGLKEEDKGKVKKEAKDELDADTVAEPKKVTETEPVAASATVEEKDTAASG